MLLPCTLHGRQEGIGLAWVALESAPAWCSTSALSPTHSDASDFPAVACSCMHSQMRRAKWAEMSQSQWWPQPPISTTHNMRLYANTACHAYRGLLSHTCCWCGSALLPPSRPFIRKNTYCAPSAAPSWRPGVLWRAAAAALLGQSLCSSWQNTAGCSSCSTAAGLCRNGRDGTYFVQQVDACADVSASKAVAHGRIWAHMWHVPNSSCDPHPLVPMAH